MNFFFFLIPLTILLSCTPQTSSKVPNKENTVQEYVEDSIDISIKQAVEQASSINEEDTVDSTSVTVLRLSHYRVPCFGEGDVEFCYLSQEGEQIGGEEWEYFYGAIVGFEEYEWGFDYELEVVKKEKPSPFPEDVSSIEYHLVKLVEKTEVVVDATFELPIKVDASTPAYLRYDEDSEEYTFLSKVKVRLGEEIIEADLKKMLSESNGIAGIFQHDKETKGILVLSIVQTGE